MPLRGRETLAVLSFVNAAQDEVANFLLKLRHGNPNTKFHSDHRGIENIKRRSGFCCTHREVARNAGGEQLFKAMVGNVGELRQRLADIRGKRKLDTLRFGLCRDAPNGTDFLWF
jgi:hypothetical protein